MKDGKIIYSNGQVLVNDIKDDKIEIQKYEYQDNIKEIFKTENIIEELENSKNYLINKIKENDEEIKSYKTTKKSLIKMNIFMSIICSIIFILINLNSSRSIISSIIVGTLIPTYLCGMLTLMSIDKIKTITKINKGFKLELEEIEKELINNKKLLNKLNNDQTKYNQKEAEELEQDYISNIHIDKLNQIRNNLILYYKIGVNENKFQKYYNQGNLEEKEEIERVKTYFKKKNK